MKKIPIYVFGAIVLFGIAVSFPETIRVSYEVVSARLFPNAERVFEYGERHFDAAKPQAYNIELADYFFWQAEALDPELPYVYHEIARIAFLKGDFDAALVIINRQIDSQGDKTPNSYYVRGLIQGFRGDYVSSARDYERYLESNPNNWAALNDYAWVLLKAERFEDAVTATQKGLGYFPENPWLLNSSATALYELGQYEEALRQVTKAQAAVSKLSETQWLTAYPGNDPKIAGDGIGAFKKAVEDNMHIIIAKSASSSEDKAKISP